jgi:pyruvate ferredoxin oxidoreductase alpha subunit
MESEKILYGSGNELAAYAAKQINYHVMGYYPITPSTQIAEQLDAMYARGEHDIRLIAAEGEHSAAGICYGAAAAGGRVINATSANGLLYALEQFPVQSGTRIPMVMNVACRTVSGPLSIKGDHSDIMYLLNTGWIIFFASEPQAVYDLNLMALKLAEQLHLPVAVAFDGFFTSHQKRKCLVFSDDAVVQNYLGTPVYDNEKARTRGTDNALFSLLDLAHPVTIGSYMNEPDLINNKYQLHLAMEEARQSLPRLFSEYGKLCGRDYAPCMGYHYKDAKILLFILGSSYHTAMEAVDSLRREGIKAGVVTLSVLRPFPVAELRHFCANASTILVADRQDSYGAGGGNMTLEVKAALQGHTDHPVRILSRIYGLGGKDFFPEDAVALFRLAMQSDAVEFDYYGATIGSWNESGEQPAYFAPLKEADTTPGLTTCTYDAAQKKMLVKGGSQKAVTAMPKRLAPGHSACPGCGIPVNINLLLSGIEGNVVLLGQTGCGMVVSTCYPKTAYRVPYLHNLFQNGAATLSGVVETFHQKQKRGEYPAGDITFIMLSGDGGMDIGLGSAIGTALRNHHLILFEYDNGGYMNTGYQLSYSTPRGAASSTSHVGSAQYGKTFFHKDSPELMAAAHIPYVATVAESHPADFVKKAAKAAAYAKEFGTAYLKALSACPLNWNDKPNLERSVIAAAVECCYFPLYEVENGITTLNYTPKTKLSVSDWFAMMGRTKHLTAPEYAPITESIQQEIDRRFARLTARAEHPLL